MSDVQQRALFADLVFNEEGEPARFVLIGNVGHYAVPDGDFLRHVEAIYVDRQVVSIIKERILGMQEAVTEGVIHLLGEEDLFTRASVGHAIEHMEDILEAEDVNLDELRTALWMAGFRVTVDVHGDVVHVEMPGAEGEGFE